MVQVDGEVDVFVPDALILLLYVPQYMIFTAVGSLVLSCAIVVPAFYLAALPRPRLGWSMAILVVSPIPACTIAGILAYKYENWILALSTIAIPAWFAIVTFGLWFRRWHKRRMAFQN